MSTKIQAPPPDWPLLIETHVATLKFGCVQIVVEDSKVVQIEVSEKFRFDKSEGRAGR